LELGLEKRTRDLVRDRACNTCEYCRLHQSATPLIAFHLEHILPKQHGKADDPAGLALACDRCNAYKAPNLTSIDADTGIVVPLFTSCRSCTQSRAAPTTNSRAAIRTKIERINAEVEAAPARHVD